MLFGAVLWWTAVAVAPAQQQGLSTPTPVPRLTVLIVAEQFRADYLQRYGSDFSDAGLRRLMDSGAWLRRSRVGPASYTAAATATLATGADPSSHGIVADAWYNARTRKLVDAVSDRNEPSPALLIGSTLADELLLSSGGGSRVVAVAGDASLAVMLAGRRPTGCYWRGPSGAFRTSTAYQEATPPWVQEFNVVQPPGPTGRRVWKAHGADDKAPPLRVLDSVDFLRLYRASPYALEDTFTFARRAVEEENLGRRGHSDLLVIGLAAPALLGLETGAYSPLMRDMVMRLDREIAGMLAWLDRRIGLDETAVVFTAAHGIAAQDDQLEKAGLPHGRVDGSQLVSTVNRALGQSTSPVLREVSVEKFVFPFLTFNPAFRALSPAARQRIVQTAGEAALRVPGVAGYFSPESSSLVGAAGRTLERSYYAGRSGDLVLAYKPYFTERYGDGRGVAPGSANRYDTDVPLLLYGRWFKPGVHEQAVSATSLAPTLAAVMNIPQPSGATGTVLVDILQPEAAIQAGPRSPDR